MARKRKGTGPQFVSFLGPVIDALQDLGGSGRPAEVVDWISDRYDFSEEQNEVLSSGQTRVQNQIHWARFYLSKAGYIDSSKRGVWSLTNKGLSNTLNRAESLQVYHEVQSNLREDQEDLAQVGNEDLVTEEPSTLEQQNYRYKLLAILRKIPPDGFERLCQRLLRESGFQQVKVTGRSGDGGIDGNGLLQINPFVSFQVLFQCKRYSGSVNVSQVRDFRGAMMGRADKGIIMTTGTFTKDARSEAIRDGVPPIELVNGENLLDMFEQLELGLTPVTAYEVDDEFFDEFRK